MKVGPIPHKTSTTCDSIFILHATELRDCITKNVEERVVQDAGVIRMHSPITETHKLRRHHSFKIASTISLKGQSYNFSCNKMLGLKCSDSIILKGE